MNFPLVISILSPFSYLNQISSNSSLLHPWIFASFSTSIALVWLISRCLCSKSWICLSGTFDNSASSLIISLWRYMYKNYFLFNASWRLSPIGINLQGPILCWLQHGEILKQKSWPKNELTKNPNSTFVSDSGFFVSKRSTFLLKNYQPWVRMHRLGPCSFIPEVFACHNN